MTLQIRVISELFDYATSCVELSLQINGQIDACTYAWALEESIRNYNTDCDTLKNRME